MDKWETVNDELRELVALGGPDALAVLDVVMEAAFDSDWFADWISDTYPEDD